MSMREYHKIDSVFKRDPDNHYKTFLVGEWSRPEFGYLQDLPWVGTEKVDGTNIRLSRRDDGTVRIGGRTDNAQIPASLLDRLDVITARQGWDALSGLTVFGEGYGGKIQRGGAYRPDSDFVVFDVQVNESGVWLDRADVVDIANKLALQFVPIVTTGTLSGHIEAVAAGGFPSLFGDTVAEGVVVRPLVELSDRRGRRIITKVKVKDFR